MFAKHLVQNVNRVCQHLPVSNKTQYDILVVIPF